MILKVRNTFDGWVYYDGLSELEIRKVILHVGDYIPHDKCPGRERVLDPNNLTVVSVTDFDEAASWHFEQECNEGIALITPNHVYMTGNKPQTSDGVSMNVAVIYENNSDKPKTVAFDCGYLMNDNGKTVEIYC